jgi:hypothetical protein
MAEATANALIGGKIYFHVQQAKPSFYGGVITGAKKIERGKYAGRILFTFQFSQSCRGVTTSHEGWGREMKIIL